MKVEVTSNKQGQSLGRKGSATRQRLMEATERLLKNLSPVELTAVAIAKEASTSSATFYMYFDDVRDILFALSLVAGNEVAEVIERLDRNWQAGNVEQLATQLVKAFNKVWNSHRPVLRYRNMEADRGDDEFDKLRMDAYQRELKVLSGWILRGSPQNKRVTQGDAYSLAVVLHAALERLASLDPEIVKNGIGMERFVAGQSRIIAQVITDTARWGLLPIGRP